MSLRRFLRAVFDPSHMVQTPSMLHDVTVEAGQLHARRLEERRVMAADTANALADAAVESPPNFAANPQPLSVQPLVTVPGNQTAFEGSPLIFSAATGRLIRIDDPDIGAGLLVVDVTAIDALGSAPPSMTLGSTSGLTSVTGNGTNVLRLEGTLANINAALSLLTFYSVDDGNFDVTVTATDFANAETGSASFQVQVANVAPQLAVFGDDGQQEGGNVDASIQVFDAGALDNPQVSWVVSHGGVVIAQGTGLSVQFFAPEDGRYDISATAVDKDGGQKTAVGDLIVANVAPTTELTGVIRDGTAHITVVIDDPGREQFTVEVAWTNSGTVTESFITTSRTLTLSHKYTPEELAQVIGDLSITVTVSDNEASIRQTLHFREGAALEVAPPKFADPPPASPSERLPDARPLQNTTAPQIIASDLGGASSRGRQEEALVQQFVLRVVGPDGEESGDYPLPDEAMENLPAFLAAAGVPDGHYRVYLVTGDLARLVVDAHLRAGRLVDPRDDSLPAFDQPPTSDDASQLAAALGIDGDLELNGAADASSAGNRLVSFDAAPMRAAEPEHETETETGAESAEEDLLSTIPLIGGVVVVAASAAGLAIGHSRTLSVSESGQRAPRFTKLARRARRLKRLASVSQQTLRTVCS
jgi:hypothetical protein